MGARHIADLARSLREAVSTPPLHASSPEVRFASRTTPTWGNRIESARATRSPSPPKTIRFWMTSFQLLGNRTERLRRSYHLQSKNRSLVTPVAQSRCFRHTHHTRTSASSSRIRSYAVPHCQISSRATSHPHRYSTLLAIV